MTLKSIPDTVPPVENPIFIEWKEKHANLISILKGMQFEICEDSGKEIVFFKRDWIREIDCGEDIEDEYLSSPPRGEYPRELLDKYKISISKQDFYEKKILRKQTISIHYVLRFELVDRGYDGKHLGIASSKSIFDIKIDSEFYWGKTWQLNKNYDGVVKHLEEIQQFIGFELAQVEAGIPQLIANLRAKFVQWKVEQAQAFLSAAASQYLYGALQQFHALQIFQNLK